MEESPLRIGLDIELAAPTILVPKSSMSLNALFIDFGTFVFNFIALVSNPRVMIKFTVTAKYVGDFVVIFLLAQNFV